MCVLKHVLYKAPELGGVGCLINFNHVFPNVSYQSYLISFSPHTDSQGLSHCTWTRLFCPRDDYVHLSWTYAKRVHVQKFLFQES